MTAASPRTDIGSGTRAHRPSAHMLADGRAGARNRGIRFPCRYRRARRGPTDRNVLNPLEQFGHDG